MLWSAIRGRELAKKPARFTRDFSTMDSDRRPEAGGGCARLSTAAKRSRLARQKNNFRCDLKQRPTPE